MILKSKWFAPLAISLLLVGCSNSEDTTNASETKTDSTDSSSYSVKDDRGIEVTFEEVPETVISLQPSNTEILFELGVGDKIVGVTDYDLYPEEALDIERVSDTLTINAERIIELNPDVIIAYKTGDKAQIDQLESAGQKVFVIDAAASVEDVYGDIEQIAQVMNVEEKGKEIVSSLESQIETIQEKTATIDVKKKVYFEIAPAPELWSIGSGTFQQELIEIAGVENLYKDQQSWFAVTEEDLISRNPDAIISTVNYVENPKAEILARAGWDSMTAVQNEEVHLLNADIIDRPGPRIGEAIELISKAIYPELYQ